MRFEISFKQDEWVIVATEGEFAGRVVAVAEGLTLEAVTFVGTTLVGKVKASWGIVLNDDITTSRTMLRALGIGQTFKSRAAHPFFLATTEFLCSETKRSMTNAAHAMVLKRGMFYGRKAT